MTPLETLVMVTPGIEVLHSHLRRLTVPPHQFLRDGVRVLLTSDDRADVARGLSRGAWCAVPGQVVPQKIITMLAVQRLVEISFHEAVARRLAWRTWHAQ